MFEKILVKFVDHFLMCLFDGLNVLVVSYSIGPFICLTAI